MPVVVYLFDMKLVEQGGHAAHMVAVRMAYQHDVQRLNALFLELLYQSRPAVCVARIDEHMLSLVLQQGRVGLAGV